MPTRFATVLIRDQLTDQSDVFFFNNNEVPLVSANRHKGLDQTIKQYFMYHIYKQLLTAVLQSFSVLYKLCYATLSKIVIALSAHIHFCLSLYSS